MATEGEKATVFRTTKVRTKLKDDLSWMNRGSELEEVQLAEEKPWMAELRARRQNGAATSPVSSPTSTAPPKSDSQKSPSSGFMIKGVFNKTSSSSTSTTSNGISGTSKVTNSHYEGNNTLHTEKPSTQKVDSKISSEEQLKRTAAASKVLNKSAAKERSYVLSAAKKFESQAAENSVAKESPPYVAKRVEIADVYPPVPPITSITSVPEPPKTQNIITTSSEKTAVVTVNKPPKVELAPPEPIKQDPPPVLAVNKNLSEDMKMDNVAAPLPELIADYLHVSAGSEDDDSGLADTHLVTITEEPELLENSSSRVETLTALYENLIPDEVNSTSLKYDEPVLAEEEEEEEEDSADTRSEEGKEQDPIPAFRSYEARTEDLSNLSSSQEDLEELVPPSPVHWSQDLHSKFESNTESVTITTQTVTVPEKSEERDLLTSHVTTTVTEFSSTDPFDPYPIGSTSPNSSSDLQQPLSDISINSSSHTVMERKEPEITMNNRVLESLAEEVIPIDTTATSLSTHRSWARTWETTTPLQTTTQERQEAPGVGQQEEQHTLVMFERKSQENDSPWDKWTSPSMYTITSTMEEEEEEESPEDSQMHTVTTITTIRETYGEQEGSTMDRTVLVEAPRTPTPEADTKKPFVYVKEYVDTTEMSSHNATGSLNRWSSSYSSSVSSPCTYCGQLVGSDAKITIEHLNIDCHPHCFKCASCWKPMGDLIDNMFLHGGKVHCESCYAATFD
ncbi:zinc finger protein 185 isoform X1 [Syngnathus typhle]|uniref:zinc finger protein 185 isoform X1 n=1 Tax=Syngnathus typhle TaxID=161592 RepID=UPI002A6ACD49|nr:zinc finger protein 185 isoform X1 [Syngnathus typhle]